MNMMTLSQGQTSASGGFRVDVSRGQRIGRVSSEWFSRPDDERYLNLPDLYDAVRGRAERAQARTVESRAIRVETIGMCAPPIQQPDRRRRCVSASGARRASGPVRRVSRCYTFRL